MLLTCLPACQNEKPKENTPLTLNLEKDLNSLDPHQVRLLREISMTRHIYEGLMRADEQGVAQLAIAQSVERLSPTTFRFHLKKTIWNDGTPLTAKDFVTAWQEALNRQTAAPLASLMFPLKNAKTLYKNGCHPEDLGVKALDPYTLDVELEYPTPFFTELTTLPIFFPKNEERTNGPYLLKEWKRTESLHLAKNPNYWDQEAVTTTALCFSMIEDPQTEHYLFEKGKLCWLGQPLSHNIPIESLSFLKKKVCHLPVDGTFWVVCNTKKTPLNDVRIRKALSYAIDRTSMIQHILGGGQLPANSPIPPGMKLSNFDASGLPLKEEAKRLYQEYLDEGKAPIKLTFNYQPQERFRRIAQFLQQEWEGCLGITINMEAIEKQLLNTKERSGECELSLGEWFADFHHPYAFFNLFEEPGGYLNPAKWEDKTFCMEIKAGLCALNENEQKEHFTLAENRMKEELPVIPLYHHSFDYLKGEEIENVVLSPLGCADFKRVRKR
jgi:oligopeptide transport system substrate-binding protein